MSLLLKDLCTDKNPNGSLTATACIFLILILHTVWAMASICHCEPSLTRKICPSLCAYVSSYKTLIALK